MSHSEEASLLEAILAGISDTRALGDHDSGPSPLDELVRAYQQEQKHDDRLPAITSDSTGRELKDAIAQLPPETQVALLARYSHATKNLSTPTEYDPKVLEKETKDLRKQVWILGGVLLFFMLSVFTGVVITTAVHLKVISAGAVLDNLLETAKDCVELFFDVKAG
jgi:hypothetical protein